MPTSKSIYNPKLTPTSKKKLKLKVQVALQEMDKLSKKAASMNQNLHNEVLLDYQYEST